MTDLVEFLAKDISPLWRNWTMSMTANRLGSQNDNKFSLSGDCPHCDGKSVFMMVTGAYLVDDRGGSVHMVMGRFLWAVLQCQGCLKVILGCGRENLTATDHPIDYVKHYPLGSPNDDVAT